MSNTFWDLGKVYISKHDHGAGASPTTVLLRPISIHLFFFCLCQPATLPLLDKNSGTMLSPPRPQPLPGMARSQSLCLQQTQSLQESQRWGSRSFPYKSDVADYSLDFANAAIQPLMKHSLNTEENPSRLPLLKGFSDDKSTYYKDHNQTTGSDDSNPSESLLPSVRSYADTNNGELGTVAIVVSSDDSNLSESLLPSVSPQANTDFGEPGNQIITVGPSSPSVVFNIGDENNDFDNPRHGTRVTRLQWMFILNGLILEMLSAYFDQLSSPNKCHYALVSLLLAIAAVLICILELIHNGIKEGVESTNGMVFCTLPDVFGLGLSVIQCLCSAEQYYFLHRHENNPVKLSPVPLFFFCCLVVLKLKRTRATQLSGMQTR